MYYNSLSEYINKVQSQHSKTLIEVVEDLVNGLAFGTKEIIVATKMETTRDGNILAKTYISVVPAILFTSNHICQWVLDEINHLIENMDILEKEEIEKSLKALRQYFTPSDNPLLKYDDSFQKYVGEC